MSSRAKKIVRKEKIGNTVNSAMQSSQIQEVGATAANIKGNIFWKTASLTGNYRAGLGDLLPQTTLVI